MRGKKHDDATRAAVLAALMAGQGVCEVAAAYKLDKSVVSRWRSELASDELQAVATKKRDVFGDMLADYLTEALTTLKAQVVFFRNETWLDKQPAAELATLHGVTADKTIRLLEAAERAAADETDGNA